MASTTLSPAPQLVKARLAVFGMFLIVGFLMATWLVNIPLIQERTDVSHGVLGGLILVFGVGSFVSMQIAGKLIDKYGSRFATMLGIIIMVLGVSLPAFATNWLTLGIALFIFGLGNGAADVAMNHQAVLVERAYGRPIMSTFHAFFSLGGAVGAGLGAATQALHVPVPTAFIGAAILAAILAVVAGPKLLPATAEAKTSTEVNNDVVNLASGTKAKKSDPRVRRRVIALAILAFLLMLSEGAASDWSALEAVEHQLQSPASASLAYGTFAVAMTLGRFCADRISHALGPVKVLRYGTALGAVGMAAVILAPNYPVTLMGWALFGIGLSGAVPQIFTAAGNITEEGSGVNLSRVVGAGYIGMLAGPAVIGWLGGHIGLTWAFALPLIFCLIGIVLATQVAPNKALKKTQPANV